MYWIKADYGYGDWSSVYENLSEEEAIEKFNKCVWREFKTIDECLNYDVDGIYTLHEGETEVNNHWMDS